MWQLPPAYFALQWAFAQEAARLADIPLTEALRRYTTLYLNLGGTRGFDPYDAHWQTYLTGLASAPNAPAWTYACYQDAWQPFVADFYGCFYYSYAAEAQTVRLHFINNAPDGHPLRRDQVGARQAELRALCSAARQAHPAARWLRGGSWLYNLPAYRRLFPPVYIATATPVRDEFPFLALWGQFLTGTGTLCEQPASRLLAAARHAAPGVDLHTLFPLQVLQPGCPFAAFAAFYSREAADTQP